MKSTDPDITVLFSKYLDDDYSPEELDVLLHYFRLDKETDVLKELITQQFEQTISEPVDIVRVHRIKDDIHQYLREHTYTTRRKRSHFIWQIAAAALVVISIGVGIYQYRSSSDTASENLLSAAVEPLVPGSNRATLILADGTRIGLSEDEDGVIVGSSIAYEDGRIISDRASSYAVLTTPKGGQYRVTLPDGTKVWLNASSSLTYPTIFDGRDRKVELTGEAYFEVSHQQTRPFIVQTQFQTVEVLGTVFNINSYPDEPSTTTSLVSGKVALTAGSTGQRVILAPGQQGISRPTGIAVADIDPEEAISWKDGNFVFHNADIYAVMRQIARWYDAEVVYHDRLQDMAFSGAISRSADIRDVLRKIELTQRIDLKIEGRRIVVSKK